MTTSPNRRGGNDAERFVADEASQRSPLLRHYVVTSLAVITAVTLVVAFLFVRKTEGDFAEASATQGAMETSHVVQMFYQEIWAPKERQTPDITLNDVIDPVVLETFVQRSTFGLDILAIKLLDLEGNVLWSNPPKGATDTIRDTDSYVKVISQGTSSSKLRRGEVISDSSGADRRLDVVRTLYPIRDAPLDTSVEGRVVGVFEME